MSKFYPQILSTEGSDHIYFSQRPFINVKAIFCAYDLAFSLGLLLLRLVLYGFSAGSWLKRRDG